MPRKRENREPRKPILILTSCLEETLYANQMKRDCRYANMNVRQKSDSVGDLEAMIREAGTFRRTESFEAVWLLVNPESITIDPSKGETYQALASRRHVHIIYNNPGLEFWFLLHHRVPETDVLSSEEIHEALQQYIPGFSMSKEYLSSPEGMQLYLKLFPFKADAVINAQEYRRLCNVPYIIGDTGSAQTGMAAFINDITGVCGRCYVSRGQLFERHKESYE